jgi:phosphatidylinositol alpha-1,6-mannosyltransferase
MNILLITFEFPPQTGGIGTYSYQIVKNFFNIGVNFTVYASLGLKSLDESIEFDSRQKMKIKRFRDYNFHIVNVIYRIIRSLWEISTSEYDMLFIAHHSAGIIGVLAKVLYKLPYVIMGHGSEYMIRKGGRYKILKLSHRYADHIIFNSRYTYKQYKLCHIPNDNTSVIWLGADDTLYIPLSQTKDELRNIYQTGNEFTLLTVGSVTPRKNHLGVLKAVKILKSKGIEIQYIIVGTGPSERVIHEIREYISKEDLEDNVKMMGYVPTEKLPEIYSLSDLFVLNSTIDEQGDVEGFGIVIIEANLMGIPAIGTKNSGIQEAIDDGESGILIPMNSPKHLAEAVEYLYTNRDVLRRMGIYSRSRALKNFTWRNTANKTLEILNSI